MKLYLILSMIFTFVNANTNTINRIQVIMGTYVSVNVQEHHEKAFERMYFVDSKLSSYNKEADIYKLNLLRKYKVHPFVLKNLNYSREIYNLTNGYFNIAIGNITRDLYRFGEDEKIASNIELRESTVGWKYVKQNSTEITLMKKVKLDFGGIGKGIAVDEASSELFRLGVKDGVISASGDIRCLGKCSIAIKNPFVDGVFAKFQTKKANIAISTSGNYRRYVKDKKHNHLINPKTKQSQQNFASVTLVSHENNAYVDALSTAISVMPLQRAFLFLKAHKELGYLLIGTDKRVYFGNLDSFVTHDIANNQKDRDYKKKFKNQKTKPFDYSKKRQINYEEITAKHINYKTY